MNEATPRLMGLERLAALRGEEGRTSAVKALIDIILANDSFAPVKERDAFLGKAIELARMADPASRKEIALKVALAERPPRQLVNAMLEDDLFVAEIILKRANYLDEELLLHMVRHGKVEHAEVIARRDDLPKAVISALIALDAPTVLQALCEGDHLFRPSDNGLEHGRTTLAECSEKSLALLFWISSPQAKKEVIDELLTRKLAEPLPPLFADDANEAVEALAKVGTSRDLRRAIDGLIGTSHTSSAMIGSEETGTAFAAGCKLIHMADHVFTQVLIRLGDETSLTLNRLHHLHDVYLRLTPAASLALLRSVDETIAPWVEFAGQGGNQPTQARAGKEIARPQTAIKDFKAGPYQPVSSPVTKPAARPQDKPSEREVS